MQRWMLFHNKLKPKVVAITCVSCLCLFLFITSDREAHGADFVRRSSHNNPDVVSEGYGKGCNLTLFKNGLDLSRYRPVIPRVHLSTCRRVLYNRVPKCASRTIRDVFSAAAPHNNFTHIFINKYYNITSDLRVYYSRRMHESLEQFVLTSHFYFHDFSYVFGETPIYINLIRDPVEWFKSMYFYKFHGSNENPKVRKNVIGTTTVRECMARPVCFQRIAVNGPLPFLCGQDDRCKTNASFAYEESAKNIDDYYLLIGLQSNLSEFIQVLEYLLPHMFHGIQKHFVDGAASANATKTLQKVATDPATDAVLRDKLYYEYKLYNYVRNKFDEMVHAIRRTHQKTIFSERKDS